jgi:hypothetical protein
MMIDVFKCKLKTKKEIVDEIPSLEWGWWKDVCPGHELLLRQATADDINRCCLEEYHSKDPEDYMCELSRRGALVLKKAIKKTMPLIEWCQKITRTYPADEITRDPIFLLQVKRIIMVGSPFGYVCIEGEFYPEDKMHNRDDIEPLSNQRLLDMGCAVEHWDTENVFFTREEAQEWADARHYRWPGGYRVYCVCAEGQLAELLKQHTVKK